uniref:Tail collar fiber protein n=1 Tax=Myoviridae sp. ctKPn8 TaxID=2827676 RepID=A0A8S5SYL3_9CAUD|nr:MAG TPA: tail collar fiber protein [Myoviridae sp. ctKPn8]
MAYGVTYITTQGAILAAKTLQSKTLKFSRFKIGSGSLQEGSVAEIKALTDLVNEEMNFDITKISRESATQVTVRGLFKNTDAESGFWLRELGLYAIDPDTEDEILFAYINYDSEAEYINNSISEKKEHYYDMIITVDNADNVTITVDPSTVYVTEEDLLEKADELTQDYDAKFSNLKSIVVASNSGAHNAIFRGKDITDLFYNGTLSQQIAAGTFDDIFIGDYIIGKTSGRKYLVADINYRLHCGDTECTKPHVLMIPEKIMGTAQMNDSNITTGGYVGSKMYTTNLAQFKTVIQNDFGSGHILNHRELLTNAVTDGKSSGWAWYDSTIELMNESMVYGHNAWGSHHGYETGIDKSQLSLFKHKPDLIVALNDAGSRYWYWLRDVVSSSSFASVSRLGIANYSNASNSSGVRPAFLIY